MNKRLFQQDLPEDIIHLILVYYDGRYKRRNDKLMFQIKYNKLYKNIYVNLLFHYGNILKSKYLINELYNSFLQNNNVNNMVNIIKPYAKMNNLQYLYN